MSLDVLIVITLVGLVATGVVVSFRNWKRENGLNDRLNAVISSPAYAVGPADYAFRASSIRAAIAAHRFDDAERALKVLEHDVGF